MTKKNLLYQQVQSNINIFNCKTQEPETPVEDEVLGDTVAPNTGDTTQLELLAVTMMMGAMGFVALKKRKEL